MPTSSQIHKIFLFPSQNKFWFDTTTSIFFCVKPSHISNAFSFTSSQCLQKSGFVAQKQERGHNLTQYSCVLHCFEHSECSMANTLQFYGLSFFSTLVVLAEQVYNFHWMPAADLFKRGELPFANFLAATGFCVY